MTLSVSNAPAWNQRDILICVDLFTAKDLAGRIHHAHLPGPVQFAGVEGFIREMEQLFIEVGHPMPAFETRKFEGLMPRPTKKLKGERTVDDINTNLPQVEPGKKATFIVQVQFRQNGTWQGTADWVDEKKTQRFRSMLELIRLMDDALTNDADGDAVPGWEMEQE